MECLMATRRRSAMLRTDVEVDRAQAEFSG
jgi:hypothetical protein